jgi:very-short-patch-repair endonuclease
MYYLPYNKNLKAFSRKLRNNSTLGEILLWKQLRAGSMDGYTFNRQKPLGNYIVDFYCKPLNLVIEVDGGYHFTEEQKIKDNERQKILEGLKLNFLRFHDDEVKKDMLQVLRKIKSYIKEYAVIKQMESK